jgi:hypothetical protein
MVHGCTTVRTTWPVAGSAGKVNPAQGSARSRSRNLKYRYKGVLVLRTAWPRGASGQRQTKKNVANSTTDTGN